MGLCCPAALPRRLYRSQPEVGGDGAEQGLVGAGGSEGDADASSGFHDAGGNL